ncbi:UDP-N-acetylglucosamine 2-epimerase (non-hydrolyzing) [Candidatus Sumerlaeota bacterium]|nr:UDP-N-acetylglucosamine 2-epimerase (non-hydrolyzing) [Candidatus Sumerlaeota bacterium]
MKVATVVGARPNFVKVAPLHHAIEAHNALGVAPLIDHVIIHTGQHYDDAMSAQFFRQFSLPRPQHHLDVGSGTHAEQTGTTMIRLEPVLAGLSPCWVVVVGDVNAALAGAITAKKLNLRVAHIEAGLRSNDWEMPEEINRVLTDRICDLLMTTSEFADANLRAEGTSPSRIVRVGNIMIDSLVKFLPTAETIPPERILGCNPGDDFVLLTLHRPSNVDSESQLRAIMTALVEIASELPVVFPVHPRTKQALERVGAVMQPGIWFAAPLGYVEMLALQNRARVIITDSGGIQEEAMMLGVPCVTLRTTTERPETLKVHGGTSRLATLTVDGIVASFREARGESRRRVSLPMWDGHTAGRIVAALVTHS